MSGKDYSTSDKLKSATLSSDLVGDGRPVSESHLDTSSAAGPHTKAGISMYLSPLDDGGISRTLPSQRELRGINRLNGNIISIL